MISVNSIIEKLNTKIDTEHLLDGRLVMQYFSEESVIGIGTDASGRVVLVLPAQNTVTSFQTDFADFDPSCRVFIEESSLQLPAVATLRCSLDRENFERVKALAVIMKGIIELQTSYGNCGHAIHEMKEFFANGFKLAVSQQKITGLFGELLVIAQSKDKNRVVGLWHTDSDAAFDFSTGNTRVEVKTTRSLNRIHQFSSNQVSESLDAKVFIASVSLQVVEKGMTLSELIENIVASLDLNMRAKLIECVVQTLGVLPELVTDVQIDEKSSIGSIWIIPS